jgi:hypothetical protein
MAAIRPRPADTAGAGGFLGIAVVGEGRVRAVVRGRLATWSSDAAYDVRFAHSNLIKSGRTATGLPYSLGGFINAIALRCRKNLGSFGKSRYRSVNTSSLRSMMIASHQP